MARNKKDIDNQIEEVLKKSRVIKRQTHFAEPITSEELKWLEKDLDIELPEKYKNFLKKHKGAQVYLPNKGTIYIYGFSYTKKNGLFMLDREKMAKDNKYYPFQMSYYQSGVDRVEDPEDIIIGSFEDEKTEIREYFTANSHWFDKVIAASKKQ
jgi:hypothetical protein